jgi:hypothetical protein
MEDETPSGFEQQNGSRQVVDEAGTIDEKVKRLIIDARSRVMEREDLLFVEAALGGTRSEHELAAMWATTVKQYLRVLEPLLRSSQIEHSQEYYLDRPLGEIVIYPPDTDTDSKFVDVTPPHVDGYPFSDLHRFGDVNETEIKRQLGLPLDADLPEPKSVQFTGLKEMIEAPRQVEASWDLRLDRGRPAFVQNRVSMTKSKPLPKTLYEDAVRLADEFRQQAGVGIETGHRTKDVEDMTPF